MRALVVVAALSLGACSFVIMEPLAEEHRDGEIPWCSGDNWLPAADTIAAVGGAVAVVASLLSIWSDGEVATGDLGGAGIGLGVAAAHGMSASWGVDEKRRCREARRAFEAAGDAAPPSPSPAPAPPMVPIEL